MLDELPRSSDRTDSLLVAEYFSELPNITGWAFAGLAAPAHWLAAELYQMYSIRQGGGKERQKAESRRQKCVSSGQTQAWKTLEV